MKTTLIYWPMLTLIAWTFVLYIILGARKRTAFKQGDTDIEAKALNPKAWPDAVVKVSNNIGNLFEAPVLFYALTVVLAQIDAVSMLTLALAWAYVALRVIHSMIHITSNYVPARFGMFMISTIVLITMTILAMVHLAGS